MLGVVSRGAATCGRQSAGAAALLCALVLFASRPALGAPPPHLFQKDECADCHLFASRASGFVHPRAFRRDINALCSTCHERERHGVGHRVGMVPSMAVPEDLHLDLEGRVTCATCHDPHAVEGRRPHLLRRAPGAEFCAACHAGGRLPARQPPAAEILFPPEGAELPEGSAVIAGRLAFPGVREVGVQGPGGTVRVPVIGGAFAARVTLAPGLNRFRVLPGQGERPVTLTLRAGAGERRPHLTSDTSQCAACHPRWERTGFSLASAPGPTCHRCHPRLDDLPHVHRLTAAGECAACHDPHGGAGGLLQRGGDALCVPCHEPRGAARHLRAVNAGRGRALLACADCHEPHQSTRRRLVSSAPGALVLPLGLASPEPELSRDGDGHTLVTMEGYEPATDPGRPALPVRMISLAVPPGADPASARLVILQESRETLPGTHRIAPAPPAATYAGGRTVRDWGAARNVRDGRDTAVYLADAAYPPASLEIRGAAALQRQPILRLAHRPLLHNPVRGTLTLSHRLTAEVRFDAAADAGGAAPEAGPPAGPGGEEELRDLGLANGGRARSWARPAPGRGPTAGAPQGAADYVIVTTREIVAGSGELQAFARHKAAMGHAVRLVTEDAYGGTTPGKPRALAIRSWLRAARPALGIRYVLLVGDPDPERGSVPMLRAWPRRGGAARSDLDAPTDHFYADLSGDWDLDRDGFPGEYRHDRGRGGVDLVAEVAVGRIPVYGGDWAALDGILLKIRSYETDPGDRAWRRSALLPMSFSDADTDGAWLAEQMRADYLAGRGFATRTLYQQGSAGGGDSVFASDAELRGGIVPQQWASGPFGLVAWWGHGSVARTMVGYPGRWDGDLVAAPAAELDDATPAFVFQTACLNGYPEYAGNLAYTLLRRGAIATVAASRVSWYFVGQRDFRRSPSDAGIGYRYVAHLTAGEPAGRALALAKGDLGVTADSDSQWMNLLGFNLYGDPGAALFQGPVLRFSSFPVEFLAAAGERVPLRQGLRVSPSKAAPTLQAASDRPWLTVSPAEGVAPLTLLVRANPAGLPVGRHRGHLTVTSPEAGNAPVAIPVTLRVTRPARISGRVLSPSGRGLARVKVSLKGPREAATRTDSRGYYRFRALPPGRYRLLPSGRGLSFLPSRAAVSLGGGASARRSFAGRSLLIRGRVLTPAGRPIPRVAVRLHDPRGVLLRQTLTSSSGTYRFGRLSTGAYRVSARKPRWTFRPASQSVRLTFGRTPVCSFTGRR